MTPIPVLPAQLPAPMPDAAISADKKLRDAALQLEATFLSEMLKSAGLGSARDAFGGGIGEDQFTSFLRDAQAKEITAAGGIGLAEALFEAMKGRADAQI